MVCPAKEHPTIFKSKLLQVLTHSDFTYANPDNQDIGTRKHELLRQYLELRKGRSAGETWALMAESEAAFDRNISPRVMLLGHSNPIVGQNLLDEVACVAETFIGVETNWKRAKLEQDHSVKILNPNDQVIGILSYRIDAIVPAFPRGKRCYDFKFSRSAFDTTTVEFEITLMELAHRGKSINEQHLPPKPKSRLIFPGFVQGQEVNLMGRTEQIKRVIITACQDLLKPEFGGDRVINRDWRKPKPRRSSDNWQRSLF